MRTPVETVIQVRCHCGASKAAFEDACAICVGIRCTELKQCPLVPVRACRTCQHALVGVDETRCRLLDEVVLNERQAEDCGEYGIAP